jgi:hypothetical protein
VATEDLIKVAATEENPFDELVKGVASGTISRRRALKLVGSAILGAGFLGTIPGVAEARTPKCRSGGGTGCTTPCRNTNKNCTCVKTSEGSRACVYQCCSGRGCSSSSACRSREVCMTTTCCGGVRGVCVTLCKESRPGYCTRGATAQSESTVPTGGSGVWDTSGT